jgi:23S rRNA (adenine2503-C2)-methyltransferase
MLAGVNDSQADAHELVTWLAGLRVHVNLIPYHPIDRAPQYKPAAQASELSRRDLHIFKQVGTRAFGTAFTRWRVGLV